MFTVWIHIENIQAFLGGGGTTHLKNMLVNWIISPILGVKNKKHLKPPPTRRAPTIVTNGVIRVINTPYKWPKINGLLGL